MVTCKMLLIAPPGSPKRIITVKRIPGINRLVGSLLNKSSSTNDAEMKIMEQVGKKIIECLKNWFA